MIRNLTNVMAWKAAMLTIIRGPPGATSISADSVESSITADRSDNPPGGGVTDHKSQAEMSGAVPTDISDPSIVLL